MNGNSNIAEGLAEKLGKSHTARQAKAVALLMVGCDPNMHNKEFAKCVFGVAQGIHTFDMARNAGVALGEELDGQYVAINSKGIVVPPELREQVRKLVLEEIDKLRHALLKLEDFIKTA